MRGDPIRKLPMRKRRALLLAMLLACSAPRSSPGQLSVLAGDSGETARKSPLDGRWFGGDWGIIGKDPHLADVIEFADGQFGSKCCVRLGFAPAPYEFEVLGDGVRFKAVTESPTHGSMVWEGTVRGDTVEARVHWRREMFLWTHSNQFWFKGRLGDMVACRGD